MTSAVGNARGTVLDSDLLAEDEREALAVAGYGGHVGLGARPAVVVVDVTRGFCGRAGDDLRRAVEIYPHAAGPAAWRALPVIASVIATARQSDCPVVFTRPLGRHGRPAPDRWSDKNHRQYAVPEDAHDILPQTGIRERDPVLAKRAPSAFAGTPLTRWLLEHRVDSVVLVGGTTSGCVRATAVDAFSLGYGVTVVEDATFDRVRFSHRASLFDLELKYGDVRPGSDVIAGLRGMAATPDVPTRGA